MSVLDDLHRAREAYERRDWVTAYDGLSGSQDELTAPDFHRLATTALLVGRRNDFVQAMQRAYQGWLGAGDHRGAARAAAALALELFMGGESAIAQGWTRRCARLLDEVGDDVVERGHLLQAEFFQNLFSGRREGLAALAAEFADYGRRFNDPDLTANGMNAEGRMRIYAGSVREGLALLDEAMVAVTVGEVSPLAAGHVYCSMIEACQELADYDRAAEWTSALTRWVDAQPGLVLFTGQCAVHRGQIMKLRGAWEACLEELERAVERHLSTNNPAPAGIALAELADVHRLRGEYDDAERSYARAVSLGYESQLDLALLWLARGHGEAAESTVRRLLQEPGGPVQRARLLPGAVDILMARGRTTEARALVDELSGLAVSFGLTALSARAAHARGLVVLDEDPADAMPQLREAVALWTAQEAPFEVARDRRLLGTALRLLGDEASGRAELEAAHRAFRDLGARPEAEATQRLLRPAAPGGLTPREVEVIRMVAEGRSNAEIAAALVLSEKTVSRHLSNIFTKLDVPSRTAAAAYAFENRLL